MSHYPLRFFIAAAMMLSPCVASAWIPDFSKALSKDSIISNNEINGTTIIKFATDEDIDTLKKTLSKVMSKDWVEIPDKVDLGRKRTIAVPKGGPKRPGTIGTVRYSNPKHEGIHIHLVILQVPAKGKAYTALLTVMKVYQ